MKVLKLSLAVFFVLGFNDGWAWLTNTPFIRYYSFSHDLEKGIYRANQHEAKHGIIFIRKGEDDAERNRRTTFIEKWFGVTTQAEGEKKASFPIWSQAFKGVGVSLKARILVFNLDEAEAEKAEAFWAAGEGKKEVWDKFHEVLLLYAKTERLILPTAERGRIELIQPDPGAPGRWTVLLFPKNAFVPPPKKDPEPLPGGDPA